MTSQSSKSFVFPRIRRVAIHNLTVYTQRRTIALELPDGVFCLAGANGLGKSTFIAAVNFGLTGRVPEPTRRFQSVNEYYSQTESFSRDYFSGRVSELDRDTAQIELQFTVGDHEYRIIRGLFETGELRCLEINGDNTLLGGVSSTDSFEALHATYSEWLPKHIGLRTFQQFVFLQHFLLTFDERRSLTFWEPQVLQETLFLAFGNDPELAADADRARRQVERLGSIDRNLTYQATETRKRLRDVEQVLASREALREDVLDRHHNLQFERDEITRKLDTLRAEIGDARLRIEHLTASRTSLYAQYEDAFAKRAVRHFGVSAHPLIVKSLADHQCNLCGQGDNVDELGKRSKGNVCPLCGSPVQDSTTDNEGQGLQGLKQIDTSISEIQSALESANSGFVRLESERLLLEGRSRDLDQQLSEMEAENRGLFLEDASASDAQIAEIAAQYRNQISSLYESRRQRREERDRFRAEFKSVQEKLVRRYNLSEAAFVRRFRTLARAFLGLDLDASLNIRRNTVNLVLEVEGTVRREIYQLSESQRFFVDIALRMAIGEFMADKSGPVTMYIDTPEGSLDIAYESRAGEMFAQFVENGSHIIMTANINTSQLLSRLASRCGPSRMWLERMTDWTRLSDVQREEEELFESAYASIEAALQSGLVADAS